MVASDDSRGDDDSCCVAEAVSRWKANGGKREDILKHVLAILDAHVDTPGTWVRLGEDIFEVDGAALAERSPLFAALVRECAGNVIPLEPPRHGQFLRSFLDAAAADAEPAFVEDAVAYLALADYLQFPEMEKTSLAFLQTPRGRAELMSSEMGHHSNLEWKHYCAILPFASGAFETLKWVDHWAKNACPCSLPDLTKYLKDNLDTGRLSLQDLAQSPPGALRFADLGPLCENAKRDVSYVICAWPERLREALPCVAYDHPGRYQAKTGAGWSCCGAAGKRDPGCTVAFRSRDRSHHQQSSPFLAELLEVQYALVEEEVAKAVRPMQKQIEELQARIDAHEAAVPAEHDWAAESTPA